MSEVRQDQGEPGITLHSPGYLKLLLFAGVLGVPMSVVAFAFLATVHQLEHLVWHTVPHELGFDDVPAWWAIPPLALAGLLVGLAVKYLPGEGGHAPSHGLGGGDPSPPNALLGVLIAAVAGLSLGAVVGPEAPLIAIGSGLALLALRLTPSAGDPSARMVIPAAGSAAAISAVFGNPLIAAILFIEVMGLARRQTMLVILPALLASGLGALVYTGLGSWTGVETSSLSLPALERTTLHLADVMSAVPLAAATAALMWLAFRIGHRAAALAKTHVLRTTIGAGLVVGLSATGYALLTGNAPTDVALSGQLTLVALGQDPGAWSTGALVALVLFKGLAYAVCLGTFRGGPVFPALMLGATMGILASSIVPALDATSGIAIGMAAGATITKLPVSSVLLVVLLLGGAAGELMPVVILAVVTALVIGELLPSGSAAEQTAEPA